MILPVLLLPPGMQFDIPIGIESVLHSNSEKLGSHPLPDAAAGALVGVVVVGVAVDAAVVGAAVDAAVDGAAVVGAAVGAAMDGAAVGAAVVGAAVGAAVVGAAVGAAVVGSIRLKLFPSYVSYFFIGRRKVLCSITYAIFSKDSKMF